MTPSLTHRTLIARSSIPLVLIGVLLATPMIGGYGALVLVLLAWRGMGLQA